MLALLFSIRYRSNMIILNFFKANKFYFLAMLVIYIIGLLLLQLLTNLSLNDSLFWLGLSSLLLSFFTSMHSRASLTKIFRFMDFRSEGVENHTKEVFEGKFSGLMQKDTDKFFIPFSTVNFIFGLLAFSLCLLMYLL